MKAVYFEKTGSVQEIKVGDLQLPEPELKNKEVRLRFLAGSLNHLDLWVLKGLPSIKYRFPQVMGADLCAEVLESRSECFSVGDQVVLYPAISAGLDERGEPTPENLCPDYHIRGESSPGIFCESFVVAERYLYKLPEHLSVEEGAALPLTYVTAWQMLTEKADLFPGQFDPKKLGKILVHGAGSGVSQALLELMLSMQISDIALSSRDPKKLEAWKKKGVAIFEAKDSLFEDLKKWAPQKIETIFDHIGEVYFEMNIRLLKNAGRFVTCGASSGYKAPLDLRHLFFRQLQLLGSTMGSLEHFRQVMGWVVTKKIKPQVQNSFSFDQAKEAYALMDRGGQDGKIVLSGAH